MAKRDQDALPDRGQERSPPSGRDDARAAAPMTFGPGYAFYAGPPIALAVGGLCLYAASQTARPAIFLWLFGSCSILAGLLFPIATWARYRLDAEGIERRTVSSRRSWPWSHIGGTRGAELEMTGGMAHTETLASRHAQTLIRRTVYDTEGFPLFRISPWTRNKRQLATQIRRRSAD